MSEKDRYHTNEQPMPHGPEHDRKLTRVEAFIAGWLCGTILMLVASFLDSAT